VSVGDNLAEGVEAVVAATPDAEAIVVDGGPRLTYAELDDRASRLASALAAAGIGPGDVIGVLLANGNEHLEVLLACFKRRAVPINLNLRFVAGELTEVLAESGARLVVHEPDLAGLLPAGLPGLARGPDYEAAIAGAEPYRPEGRSGDDHYVLYTGGTTGRPKAVRWRHADLRAAALAGGPDLTARRVLVACPFFHGTGQWTALIALLGGATVLTSRDRGLDAAALWSLADTERASHLVVVGDAYARPLADALPGPWSLDGLSVLLSGGAPLSPGPIRHLLEVLPWLLVVDGYGATETGGQARLVSVAGAVGCTADGFRVDDDTAVLDDDLRPIPPTDRQEGWLARRGAVPLGYDGDEEATAQTFPLVDGVRWAVPGDRARWVGPGRVEILGRGNLTVNTGGEKVHVEEVEAVLRQHRAVADVVVVGVPDERWGEVVAAVVAPAEGCAPELAELADHCRLQLAGFKVPRRLVLVDRLHRAASGKPDYRWARETCVQDHGPSDRDS
jgi:acyl-CoA synthetase (AMP-forming)/AMP-acid ligase II